MNGGDGVPRVVTLSSLYGTSDSLIGRGVAEELGVEFVDREIPEFVARRLGLSAQDVTHYLDEHRSRLERVVNAIARAPVPSQETPPERLDIEEYRYRAEVEAILGRIAARGGVILGRAAAVVLRDVAAALHVRLVGPHQARVAQIMELEGVERKTAEFRVHDNDDARQEYGLRLYGADPADPHLYHLVIDSTAIEADACVRLIVIASHARARSGWSALAAGGPQRRV